MTRTPVLSTASWLAAQWRRAGTFTRHSIEHAPTFNRGWWL